MKDSPHDEPVGYRQPPRRSRWKKGQSGDSRKRKTKRPESALATVSRLLLARTPVTLNGEEKRITALEAIVLQLIRKAASGNARAFRALLKYKQFAGESMKKKVEISLMEDVYTEALAKMAKQNE